MQGDIRQGRARRPSPRCGCGAPPSRSSTAPDAGGQRVGSGSASWSDLARAAPANAGDLRRRRAAQPLHRIGRRYCDRGARAARFHRGEPAGGAARPAVRAAGVAAACRRWAATVLATRNLAPLRWMAEQARQITGSNLHTPPRDRQRGRRAGTAGGLLQRAAFAARPVLRQHAALCGRRLPRAAHAHLGDPRRGRRGARPGSHAGRIPRIAGHHSRRIAPALAPGGRPVKPRARRCRHVRLQVVRVLLQRSAGRVLPLAAGPGRGARHRARLPPRRATLPSAATRNCCAAWSQPARQRHPLHPGGRQRGGRARGRRATACGCASPIPASGIPAEAAAAYFRAVLPGRQGAHPRRRRLRPGTLDREMDRRDRTTARWNSTAGPKGQVPLRSPCRDDSSSVHLTESYTGLVP